MNVSLAVTLLIGQSIPQIGDVDGGPGFPKLTEMAISWDESGWPTELSVLILGEAKGPHGLKLRIHIGGKKIEGYYLAKICGTYEGVIARPIGTSERAKVPLVLDTKPKTWRCEPDQIEFSEFQSAAIEIVREEAARVAEKEAAEAKIVEAAAEKAAAKELANLREKQRAVLQKLTVACARLYDRTSQKRLIDVTVEEADEIQSCKVVGLYKRQTPPPPLKKATTKH